MYMNDIKLLDKNKKEVETLIQAVRIYREDKGTEFAIDKCAMQKMKSLKWHMTEGIELPNQDKIRTLVEMAKIKFHGILKADIIKH